MSPFLKQPKITDYQFLDFSFAYNKKMGTQKNDRDDPITLPKKYLRNHKREENYDKIFILGL